MVAGFCEELLRENDLEAVLINFCYYEYIKMSNLLHVGLILIISRVFTILYFLCLCRNREHRGNFQNKTVISKLLFCQMSAKVK